MKKNTLFVLIAVFIAVLFTNCQASAPEPYGPIPSQKQLDWQKMETYMFIHFGPNTFTNKQWGDGKEDPKVFNPVDLDCNQWVSIAKEAGLKAIIITAKHHDGFSLWPSQYSTHTVRESAWKDGKGDVLKELSEACEKQGLKFGVYLSPWDQNHPTYGTPEYNGVFVKTLEEIHSNYGEIFEQWFDGACGEGANGKMQEYDWELFNSTVYKKHPNAIIFSDVGPDCRWMGNERGVAGETNWSRLNTEGFVPGKGAPKKNVLATGDIDGKHWIPAEVDVSIKPGWFYTPDEDGKARSLAKLVDIYYTSVGRNANLLLNIPIDRRGLVSAEDSARLIEFRKVIAETFATNLIEGAKVTSSKERGSKFSATNLVDGDFDSYWATADEDTTAELTVTLPEAKTFNRLQLQEYIPLGQRVAKFSVEYWDTAQSEWKPLTQAATIGYKRILRFDTITTDKLRINIEESLACPVLNELGLFFEKPLDVATTAANI